MSNFHETRRAADKQRVADIADGKVGASTGDPLLDALAVAVGPRLFESEPRAERLLERYNRLCQLAVPGKVLTIVFNDFPARLINCTGFGAEPRYNHRHLITCASILCGGELEVDATRRLPIAVKADCLAMLNFEKQTDESSRYIDGRPNYVGLTGSQSGLRPVVEEFAETGILPVINYIERDEHTDIFSPTVYAEGSSRGSFLPVHFETDETLPLWLKSVSNSTILEILRLRRGAALPNLESDFVEKTLSRGVLEAETQRRERLDRVHTARDRVEQAEDRLTLLQGELKLAMQELSSQEVVTLELESLRADYGLDRQTLNED
ncbi:hypothetical protein KC878_02395 [Candidatus Saccharibacteria bacterium]|nr:hypothetical protein [Candidatus Saccharibacteria bacterium]MCB9821349.1 hypothetical protein [Candidatus Nomurabacteria bacterium]